jgi:hypothetical protein
MYHTSVITTQLSFMFTNVTSICYYADWGNVTTGHYVYNRKTTYFNKGHFESPGSKKQTSFESTESNIYI